LAVGAALGLWALARAAAARTISTARRGRPPEARATAAAKAESAAPSIER